MLPTEDLFANVYVLIDDAIAAGAISVPARPGPAPAGTSRQAAAALQPGGDRAAEHQGPRGSLLLNAQFPVGVNTYRAYRLPWPGR